MIDKKEIRIGNWFSHDEVECNAMWHSGYFQWQEGDWHYLVECGIDLSNIHPIPLTEDILLKCGFDENYYHFSIGDFILRKPDFVVCDMGIRVQPKHLHQLQNLYFTLTNTELKINLHSK